MDTNTFDWLYLWSLHPLASVPKPVIALTIGLALLGLIPLVLKVLLEHIFELINKLSFLYRYNVQTPVLLRPESNGFHVLVVRSPEEGIVPTHPLERGLLMPRGRAVDEGYVELGPLEVAQVGAQLYHCVNAVIDCEPSADGVYAPRTSPQRRCPDASTTPWAAPERAPPLRIEQFLAAK